MQHEGQRNNATEMFGQLEQLIETNTEELKIEETEFKFSCIRAADTIAYHMKKIGKSYLDFANSKELAEKMNVDEIHFFTPEELGFAAMLMIDADGLKAINDTYGHYMGDSYLKAIGDTLKRTAKENSVVARLGGDEYAVFLYGFENKEELEHVIAQIKEIRGTVFKQEKTHAHTLQFSMGYVLSPDEGTDFHALIRIADERMYQDKKLRKARI